MKKFLLGGAAVIALGVAGAYQFGLFDAEENVRVPKKTPAVQAFKEISLDFTHAPAEGRFPFTGGTAIDVDGNGSMEIFISGSQGQSHGLFEFRNGELINIASEAGLEGNEAAFGATSFDIDNDGDTDLILAQHDGVWIYTNTGGKFKGQKVQMNAPAESFPLTVGVTDLNKDGRADLYVSNFVEPSKFVSSTFNNPDHAKTNNMLLNLGGGQFKDVTEQTGTKGSQNTFHSAFVDLDGNGHQDLILANNTGQAEIFKNNGNLRFEKITSFQPGLGYWMGLGVGDIDKDGDQDIYLSNIGSSIPEGLVRGDLRDEQQIELEWLVLRNDGDFKLTDVTSDYQLDGYGFAWGGVFEDINLDGELDFLVAQNYIKWPGHNINKLPNKAFLKLENGYYHIDELGLNNPYYGKSALIADIDGDTKPDVVWLNMEGPARAFLNQSPNN